MRDLVHGRQGRCCALVWREGHLDVACIFQVLQLIDDGMAPELHWQLRSQDLGEQRMSHVPLQS